MCVDRWYYFRNSGLQNQDTLYTCDAPGAEGKVFYDPNELSDDGTISLSTISFTNNGVSLSAASQQPPLPQHTSPCRSLEYTTLCRHASTYLHFHLH